MNDPQNHFDWERFIGLLLAIGVVIVFVFFLFLPPDINQLTLPIIRFLAALAAGLSAYLFAGSLDFVGSLSNRIQVKAAGAFAAFIAVFFLFSHGLPQNPVVSDPQAPPTSIPEDQTLSDFSTLESLLSSGNWRESDRETGKVMLDIMGRAQQGTIEPGNISSFPCEELREIDSLWVKYSNGKFGFSVQEEIWAGLGSPTVVIPGKISELNTFMTFVGWGFADSIFSYEDFDFDIEQAPKGHLPAWLHDVYCFGESEKCFWEVIVAPLVRTEICISGT
ncbi:putative GUN4 domain-containing protein [Halomicronema hongdechloris C2206]|uniref:GUN4 domain-containing protein n=1 Tax=Halomicronema hongdechloris C2206 TaxID=1641165 RepID=A0A1Z3HTM6_9CYAN|nr:GUN4 domain-containing protein [Halomicronema hongdechloris]ASC73681.1 putative GUN4 domain-containing protein [Halomicronema hongdechloris C2206]